MLNYTGFNFKDMFFYQETLTRYSTVKINCFKTYQRNKNNKKYRDHKAVSKPVLEQPHNVSKTLDTFRKQFLEIFFLEQR